METLEVGCFIVRDGVALAREHVPKAFGVKGQSAGGGGIGFAAGEPIFNKTSDRRSCEAANAGVSPAPPAPQKT